MFSLTNLDQNLASIPQKIGHPVDTSGKPGKAPPSFSLAANSAQRSALTHGSGATRKSTPLHVLARAPASAKAFEVFHKLFAAKDANGKPADLDVQDKDGNTFLHHAVMTGNFRLLQKVGEEFVGNQSRKLDMSVRNDAGFTAMELADRHGLNSRVQMAVFHLAARTGQLPEGSDDGSRFTVAP